MRASKAKYNVLKLQYNDMYERGNALLDINSKLREKLFSSEAENNSLRHQLTTARRNLAKEELNNKFARNEAYNRGKCELEELRHQNELLRDLISSQGAIINEVFNR